MRYQFYIVDVFTEHRFGGNQLAVLPDASGLSAEQMAAITREFNFAESTFVLPASDAANTRQVRIFTPGGEVPFAGHPNVGTAFVLAATGAIRCSEGTNPIRFEELAGLVPVQIEIKDGTPVNCELTAPQPLSLGEQFSAEACAEALQIGASDILTASHQPTSASVGLPFVLVEVASRDALARASGELARLEPLFSGTEADAVHVYTKDCAEESWDIQARMFAAGMGIVEDAATGSANCALAALLADLAPEQDHAFEWSIAQGIEMGRPSRLHARATKSGGEVTEVRIGGSCVMFADGVLDV